MQIKTMRSHANHESSFGTKRIADNLLKNLRDRPINASLMRCRYFVQFESGKQYWHSADNDFNALIDKNRDKFFW